MADVSGISTDLVAILTNVYNVLDRFWFLLTAIVYFIGLVFAVRTLFLLKQYGELRGAMASQRGSLRKPLVSLLIAVGLMYSPGLIQSIMTTVYSTPDIIYYQAEGSPGMFDSVMGVGGTFIQLIGYIAFVRGWVLLGRIGEEGAQPGALARALVHIIAGILAMNIFLTFTILKNTVLGVV